MRLKNEAHLTDETLSISTSTRLRIYVMFLQLQTRNILSAPDHTRIKVFFQ